MAVSGCSLVLGTSVLPGEGRVLAAELAADGSAEGSFVEAAASRAGAGIFVAAVVGSHVVGLAWSAGRSCGHWLHSVGRRPSHPAGCSSGRVPRVAGSSRNGLGHSLFHLLILPTSR